jgi:ubiquinone/menaquinone biosynthesis C-methylase UbiE
MHRSQLIVAGLGAGAAAIAVSRHFRGAGRGVRVPGGILIGDAGAYDAMTRLLLGGLYDSVASNVVATMPPDARVLEVGCGPGHLSLRLARQSGVDVTGLDLDPAMIDRARANADRVAIERHQLSFVVGDVAALPFPDGSFDLVVSMLSMHHWDDAKVGLAEIGRVLSPGGRALVWDLRPGAVPLHSGMPDPVEQVHGSALRVVSAMPWRWPWRFSLSQRIELVAADL